MAARVHDAAHPLELVSGIASFVVNEASLAWTWQPIRAWGDDLQGSAPSP